MASLNLSRFMYSSAYSILPYCLVDISNLMFLKQNNFLYSSLFFIPYHLINFRIYPQSQHFSLLWLQILQIATIPAQCCCNSVDGLCQYSCPSFTFSLLWTAKGILRKDVRSSHIPLLKLFTINSKAHMVTFKAQHNLPLAPCVCSLPATVSLLFFLWLSATP